MCVCVCICVCFCVCVCVCVWLRWSPASVYTAADSVPKERKLCGFPGCTKSPVFGVAGAPRGGRMWCAAHRGATHTRLNVRRCCVPGCGSVASFGAMGAPGAGGGGVAGGESNTAVRCRAHRLAGQVNVVDARCQHPQVTCVSLHVCVYSETYVWIT